MTLSPLRGALFCPPQLCAMPSPSRKAAPPAGPEPASAPAAEVLRQFRIVFSAVRRHFREVEKSAGLGGAQVWALSEIRARPGLGVTELALAMDVHQSTASNLVRNLLTRKLIRSEQGATDRRAVHLHILPAGRAVLKRVPRPFKGVLPKALEELDEATLRRLQADLATLINVLGAEDEAAQTLLSQM